MTTGHPQLVAIIPRAEIGANELLRAAAAAVAHSQQISAQAILAFAQDHGVPFTPAQSANEIHHEGIVAQVDRREVLVGSESLLRRFNVELSHDILREVRRRRERGETALLVAVESRMLGAIFVV
jgi:cation transport ATPase